MPQLLEGKETLRKFRKLASSADPIVALGALSRLSEHEQASVIQVIAVARSRDVSWQKIGEALGVSKQAVLQKYGPGGRYDVEALYDITRREPIPKTK